MTRPSLSMRGSAKLDGCAVERVRLMIVAKGYMYDVSLCKLEKRNQLRPHKLFLRTAHLSFFYLAGL